MFSFKKYFLIRGFITDVLKPVSFCFFFIKKLVSCRCRNVEKFGNTLRKICQNTSFLWPIYSHIRTKPKILSLYENIRFRENPYSGIIYAVIVWYWSEVCQMPQKTKNSLNHTPIQNKGPLLWEFCFTVYTSSSETKPIWLCQVDRC